MYFCFHKLPFAVFLISLLSPFHVHSQVHIAPENGGDGIPGVIPRSYEIYWAPVDSAYLYEYIISDNPACFEGCSGDTRQRESNDTMGLEFNLQENAWYFWITRIYYENGDTTPWTTISSFLTVTPPEIIEKGQLTQIIPNPTSGSVKIKFDWGVNPDARTITLDMYSLNGLKVHETVLIEKIGNSRYQEFTLPYVIQNKGIYIAEFIIDDNPNNPNNRVIKKLIVTE